MFHRSLKLLVLGTALALPLAALAAFDAPTPPAAPSPVSPHRAIERAKVQLSTADEARIDFDEERIHLHETVTRAEFEAASAHLIDELEACTDELLTRVPAGLKIDSVFLTGGSSHVPAVQRLFARKFGADRLRTADAFTSVVEGLGRAVDQSFQLSGER